MVLGRVDEMLWEFIIALAVFIGAAGFAGKGSKLWKDGQYKSLVPSTMFGQYRKEYRFKQWCQFVPSIWVDMDVEARQNDPWFKFAAAIKDYNLHQKATVMMSERWIEDESMSAWHP